MGASPVRGPAPFAAPAAMAARCWQRQVPRLSLGRAGSGGGESVFKGLGERCWNCLLSSTSREAEGAPQASSPWPGP